MSNDPNTVEFAGLLLYLFGLLLHLCGIFLNCRVSQILEDMQNEDMEVKLERIKIMLILVWILSLNGIAMMIIGFKVM